MLWPLGQKEAANEVVAVRRIGKRAARYFSMTSTIIGVIADDFTGATDVASMLVRGGMRVVQTIGVPSKALLRSIEADAVVVALKSRTTTAAEAVAQSLAALEWLRAQHSTDLPQRMTGP